MSHSTFPQKCPKGGEGSLELLLPTGKRGTMAEHVVRERTGPQGRSVGAPCGQPWRDASAQPKEEGCLQESEERWCPFWRILIDKGAWRNCKPCTPSFWAPCTGLNGNRWKQSRAWTQTPSHLSRSQGIFAALSSHLNHSTGGVRLWWGTGKSWIPPISASALCWWSERKNQWTDQVPLTSDSGVWSGGCGDQSWSLFVTGLLNYTGLFSFNNPKWLLSYRICLMLMFHPVKKSWPSRIRGIR